MKRLLVVLLCFLIGSTHAEASISFIQRLTGGAAASSASTVTGAFTPTAGNLIVILIGVGGATKSVSSITNTGSAETWLHAGSILSRTDGNYWVDIWYAYNCVNSGSIAVTINFNTAGINRSYAVQEFSGVQTASDPLDDGAQTGAAATGTTLITTNNVGVTADSDVIVAFSEGNGPPNVTDAAYAGTAFQAGLGADYFVEEYHIVSSAEKPTATQNTSALWLIKAASFKTSAGATTPVCPPPFCGVLY